MTSPSGIKTLAPPSHGEQPYKSRRLEQTPPLKKKNTASEKKVIGAKLLRARGPLRTA